MKNKNFGVQFLRYKSAQDLVVKYFRNVHPKMNIKNLLKQETEFKLIIDGKPVYPGTVKELIIVINNLGYWAFCDKLHEKSIKSCIHYWIAKKAKADRLEILDLFAHEVGHAIGYNSENMASKFGAVASFAYSVMLENVYKEDPKTGKLKCKKK